MRSPRHLWTACLAVAVIAGCARAPQYNVLIRNGVVHDGTGDAPRTADIAIVEDRIVAVGSIPADAAAGLTIDAAGRLVAPGFIDAFAGEAQSLLNSRSGALEIAQGVTTAVLSHASADERRLLEAQGTAPNVAWLADPAAADADFLAGASGAWLDRTASAAATSEVATTTQRRGAVLVTNLPPGIGAEEAVTTLQQAASSSSLPVALLLADPDPSRSGGWSAAVSRSHAATGPATVRMVVDPTDMAPADLNALLGAEQTLVATGGRHPAAFPLVLARQRRGESPFSVSQEIRRLTSLPAARLALRQRGTIRANYFADLVIVDPAALDSATPARSIEYVIVNGVVAVAKGTISGARPGRVLAGPAAPRPGDQN